MAPETSDHLLGIRQRHAVSFFGAEKSALQIFPFQVLVRIRSTLGGGPNREFEAFYEPIPKFAGPHHVFGAQHRHDTTSQRHKVCVTSHFNCLGGTYLNT